ncbi:hypothetical protein [Neolewinella antarctica]|uniref:Outer membrane protein beta-barrel domain-containing protein n=1 Tax=Neolewinella antarctica TaxID=442734 RepID=A0ABX0XHU4_9BACT|nr:hypothetical protein [Neolewinella antarctica]NJC28408.1 hypothetical protein [Neolewinella antarctica]
MPHPEEELSRRLREGQSEPDHSADDLLWSSIVASLPVGSVTKDTRSSRWAWLIVLLLLLLGGGAWWLINQHGTGLSDTIASEVTAASEKSSNRGDRNDDLVIPYAGNCTDETTSIGISARDNRARPIGAAYPITLHPRPRKINDRNSETANAALPIGSPKSRVQVVATNPIKLASPTIATPAVNALPVTTLTVPDRAIIVDNNPDEVFRKKRSAWSISAFAGANYLNEQFTGGAEPGQSELMNDATFGTVGQSAGLVLNRRLGSGFLVTSGLEVHRTHTLLDHEATVDTIATHPSFPGQTTDGLGRYTVTHNNKLTWLSVPIGLAYERRIGSVVASLGVGLNANYQIAASGKVLDPSGLSSAVMDVEHAKRLHLSYRLQPSLTLPLSENGNWQLQLRTSLNRLNFGRSADSGLKRSAWMYGGSVGVIYR